MSSKVKCSTCQKEFTKQTLKKYQGVCGKCNKSNSSEKTINYSDELKREGWEKYQNPDRYENNCYVCDKFIYKHDFCLGHTQSKYDKKTLTVNDVRLICKPCFIVCGTKNIDEYKKNFHAPGRLGRIMNTLEMFDSLRKKSSE